MKPLSSDQIREQLLQELAAGPASEAICPRTNGSTRNSGSGSDGPAGGTASTANGAPNDLTGAPVGAAGVEMAVPRAPEVKAPSVQPNSMNGPASLLTEVDNKVRIRNLNHWYDTKQVLKNISLDFPANRITSLIGPSGCGKTTLLRSMNRLNELIPGARTEGEILVDGVNIHDERVDVVGVRKKVGMVFQKPNPFPKSIYENIAFGLRINGMKSGREMDRVVEESLEQAGLWEEVKDRLGDSALRLSGGQQQRLCIARAIAVKPDVLLMDEPCSALDPISTRTVENLIRRLKESYTIIMVTHNMQQAQRISDRVVFLFMGELIEEGSAAEIFQTPEKELTLNYVNGVFG